MNTQRDRWYESDRLAGLRRFAIAITVLNVLGHTVLGFEQSWAHPLAALASTYVAELLLEVIGARASGRRAAFAGGFRQFVDFLLPAHISGLAVAMLLYANDRMWPVVFASVVAISSKALIQVSIGGKPRHVMNPSNTGISVALLLFPSVGIAPPYQFAEGTAGGADLVLPCVILISGSFLNTRFTHKLPLIAAWIAAFALQAALRAAVGPSTMAATLMPMTGPAFLLYTFYMITDPATTPSRAGGQVVFGVAVAAVYAVLVEVGIVFDLFFALTLVCALRGIGIVFLNAAATQRVTASSRTVDAVAPTGMVPSFGLTQAPTKNRSIKAHST